MRMLTLVRIALLCCIPGIVACGDDETVQGPQDQPAEEESLDFSAIEGSWSGTGTTATDVDFSITTGLEASARPGRQVGGIRYSIVTNSCTGSLFAMEAQHPSYTVQQSITEGVCADGTVRLTLNDSGTLDYRFTPEAGNSGDVAQGTLTGGK